MNVSRMSTMDGLSVDADGALATLLQMGFPEDAARRALRQANSDVSAAVNVLLQGPGSSGWIDSLPNPAALDTPVCLSLLTHHSSLRLFLFLFLVLLVYSISILDILRYKLLEFRIYIHAYRGFKLLLSRSYNFYIYLRDISSNPRKNLYDLRFYYCLTDENKTMEYYYMAYLAVYFNMLLNFDFST